MLQTAAAVGLPTTSWQPGAPERTIFAVESVTFYSSDVNISLMAQGGFLQTAASGSVAFTTFDGTTVVIPVTADPSNPSQNPTGDPGWLDLLTVGVYGTTRIAATFASGPLAIANLKGSTVGPYAPGTYHVANVTNGATYSNPASLTVPSSAIAGTGGVVTNVQPGPLYTIVTTQSAHGLSVGNIVYLVIPPSAGLGSTLNGVFAQVLSVTATTFQASIASAGTYTSGGTVYLCTVAEMVADVAGIGSNAGPGTVSTAVTQSANVFVGNVVAWYGYNWESNTSLADRAVLSLAARSPNGPSQAYVYFAESATQFLAAESPPVTLSNGPVTASNYLNPQTGVVVTIVASATPATTTLGQPVTPGVSNLAITGVSATNPAVVSCAGPTTLQAGQTFAATIAGVLGPAAVNGSWTGTYVSPTSFSVPVDTTAAPAYTGGGVVEGGDLGQIDQLLQQNVVPNNDTAITVSALALPVAIVATVAVPRAQAAAYALAAPAQLATLLQSYAVGGNAPDFAVDYDDVVGALEEAGVVTLGATSYVRQIVALSITVGATPVPPAGQIPFPSAQYQAVLTVPVINVVGV